MVVSLYLPSLWGLHVRVSAGRFSKLPVWFTKKIDFSGTNKLLFLVGSVFVTTLAVRMDGISCDKKKPLVGSG